MLATRLNELWRYLKYMPPTSAILVGHSNFFYEMVKRSLDPIRFSGQRQLAENLCANKLDNGACLHIRVSFDARDADCGGRIWSTPRIVDAMLMYGSKMKKKE
jgi:hypothetical protein